MPYVKFNDRDNDKVFPWKSKQKGGESRYDYYRKLLYGITIVNLTAIAKLLYYNLSVTGVVLIRCKQSV